MDAQGRVQEFEPLQSGGMSEGAVELTRSRTYAPNPQAAGLRQCSAKRS
ncbi:MAG: hypothetical protein M3N54_10990 [Acidobacteriota bacterium]|nr:hypothetical protein [Acidobacteriota bacterium]